MKRRAHSSPRESATTHAVVGRDGDRYIELFNLWLGSSYSPCDDCSLQTIIKSINNYALCNDISIDSVDMTPRIIGGLLLAAVSVHASRVSKTPSNLWSISPHPSALPISARNVVTSKRYLSKLKRKSGELKAMMVINY